MDRLTANNAEEVTKLKAREKELLDTLNALHADVRENPRVTGSKGTQVANPLLTKLASLEREYRETIKRIGDLTNFFGRRR